MGKLNIPGATAIKKPARSKKNPAAAAAEVNQAAVPGPEEKTALDILFPEQEVELPNGVVVVVRPLSLKDLPKVSQSFGRLMAMAELGYSPAELAGRAFGELAELIPYCINVPPEKIPATFGPDIMTIVVEQNVSEEVISKWQALVEKVAEYSPGEVGTSQGTDLPPTKK